MTTIPPTVARLLAGGCTLVLTLTACGGSDDTGAPDPSSPAESSTTVTGGDGTGTAAGGRVLSPIDEFLGFGVAPSAEQEAEDGQRQRRTEQLIAECMQAKGFEYTPNVASVAAPEPGPWDLPPDEFARQYGYGITTIDDDDVPTSDPNAALVEAMSVPEKRAYYLALYGDMITVDDDGALTKRRPVAADAEVPDTDSCSVQASTEVYGASDTPPDGADDPFAPLREEIGALYERVENERRVVEARGAWSACMADAGYPGFQDVYDASVDVSDQAVALMGDAMDPAAADPDALQKLRAYEIAVATADLACRAEYDAVRNQVQTEVEEAFIDEHRAELEQYRDAIAAGDVSGGVG